MRAHVGGSSPSIRQVQAIQVQAIRCKPCVPCSCVPPCSLPRRSPCRSPLPPAPTSSSISTSRRSAWRSRSMAPSAMSGRSRPAGPATTRRTAPSSRTAWTPIICPRNGTMRRCRTRSSSTCTAMPFTAFSTSSTSAFRSPMAACGCRPITPRRCSSLVKTEGMKDTTVIVSGRTPGADGVPVARRSAPVEASAAQPMQIAPGYGDPAPAYAQQPPPYYRQQQQPYYAQQQPYASAAAILRAAAAVSSAAALLRAAMAEPAAAPAVAVPGFQSVLRSVKRRRDASRRLPWRRGWL